MGRGLSAAAKTYDGGFLWAVELVLRDTTALNYAEADIVFGGTTYTGLVIGVNGFTMFRSIETNSGSFALSNVNLVVEKLIAAKAFDGAAVTIKQLLIEIGESVEIARGILTDEENSEEAVSFDVIETFDPAANPTPFRVYSNLCTHIYKDDECGSVSGLTTCSKTFAECTTRSAIERFNGFPTVTRKNVRNISLVEGSIDPDGEEREQPADGPPGPLMPGVDV